MANEPMNNDEQDSHKTIVERLQSLTIDGDLPWRPYFNDIEFGGMSDQAMQEATQPNAYILIDQEYGFGVVAIKIRDEQDEVFEPTLFIQGERIDVSDKELGTLLDAIKAHLDEIREGARKNKKDRMEEEIESAIKPYEEKVRSMQHELEAERDLAMRLLTVVENLSEPTTMQVPQRQASNTQAAAAGTAQGPSASQNGSQVPKLTIEVLKEIVWEYTGVGISREEFEDYFDERKAREVINDIQSK